jgi:DNA-binding PadR family transcriptional regulator
MIVKKFFLGFIRIHILHHASKAPVYGQWMMDELRSHGYAISPGTMYPILHDLENSKYIKSAKKNVGGKIRRYYTITKKGKGVLTEARVKINELVAEVIE